MTLTPRIVRILDLRAEDLQPFRVGRDSSLPLIDVPLPAPLPQPVKPPGEIPEGIFPPVQQPPRSPLLPVPQTPAPAQPLKPPTPVKPGNQSPPGPR